MRVINSCPNGCANYTAWVAERKFSKRVVIKIGDICPVCGTLMRQAYYSSNVSSFGVIKTRTEA